MNCFEYVKGILYSLYQGNSSEGYSGPVEQFREPVQQPISNTGPSPAPFSVESRRIIAEDDMDDDFFKDIEPQYVAPKKVLLNDTQYSIKTFEVEEDQEQGDWGEELRIDWVI